MRLPKSVRFASLAVVLLAAFVAPSAASAAFIHPTVTASFGPNGTSGTTFASLNRMAFRQSSKRLYVFDAGGPAIHGFDLSTPGTYSPLGGAFPVNVSAGGGDPDIAVDDSVGGSGNVYYISESNGLAGFTSNGSPVFTVERSSFGDPCGVATDASGNALVGDYGEQRVSRFLPTGGASGGFSVSAQGSPCHLGADPGTGDVYVANYNGATYRYTAASNYTQKNLIDGGSAAAITVDSVSHLVYVVHSNGVTSYRPDGTEVEEFGQGIGNLIGAAVDGSTGVVYLAVSSSNQIKVLPGVTVPDVTAGQPTDFATAHGHVDPASGGPVTGCEFQVSRFSEFPGPQTQSVPCEPATPYAGAEDVSADLTSKVEGEETFHYRLKVSNANGSNFSSAVTFTPHFVAGLHAEPATEVDRTSATLNGSFLGTNEETSYHFEWGPTLTYGHTTPVKTVPPNTTENFLPEHLSEGSLEPQQVYHYRIVATNSKGESKAEDETFETKPAVFGLTTDAATGIKTSVAELHGSFTGDGLDVKYFYEYGSSTLYGNTVPGGELTAPSGPTTIPGAAIDELQPLHVYHYRVVAENSFGRTNGPDRTLTTNTAPIIVSLSSAHVTGTTAELLATINPHGVPAEARFEYGPTTSYGFTAPVEPIPAGEAPFAVKADLTNLNGGVYHFRIVAENEFGESVSRDQTFNFYSPECPNATVRQQTGANSLPDCRAYELVTPEDQGITIVYPATVPFSATATAPSRLAFVGAFGLIPGSGEAVNNNGDLYVSTRTSQGWKSKFVGLPSSKAALGGGPPWIVPRYEPDKFQENLLTNPSLSTFVDWDNGIFNIGGLFEEEHEGNSYAPYVWNSTTNAQIDRWPTNVGAIPNGTEFRGQTAASADLSHFVFSSDIPFAPGGEPGDVYDNNTTQDTVTIASVKDNGEHIKGAVPQHVSQNGSRILISVRPHNPGEPIPKQGDGELYLRVNGEHTYEIAPGQVIHYLDMTPDGEKIYFTTAAALLPEDTDTSVDLYMWAEESDTPGHLVEISKGNEPSAGNTDECSANGGWTERCGIQPISFTNYTQSQGGLGGSPLADNFVAPDNGDIYFLSPEQLAGNNGVNGEENLYDYVGGKLQFVTSLEPSGVACTQDQGQFFCSENAVARMETTPNDEYMAFLTGSKVTGYDNAGHSEMYVWRPAAEEMICVSCVPSGEPPTADARASHNGRFLTNDGRAFFETDDALVIQDTNESGDVYEYVDGRPQLITSGTNVGNDSSGVATIMALPGLVGVSAEGTDVYISTYDVLVGQDRNGEAIKIYDARVGGGFQFTPPVPPCVAADECHGPSTEAPAPSANGTGSELGGTGNLQSSTGGKSTKQGHKRHKRGKKPKKSHRKVRHSDGGHRNG